MHGFLRSRKRDPLLGLGFFLLRGGVLYFYIAVIPIVSSHPSLYSLLQYCQGRSDVNDANM